MAQRMLALVVVLAVLAAPVPAQWLERTIYPPDTIVGVTQPSAIAYRPTGGVVYVGGRYDPCVLALDAATGAKIARIPIPGAAANLLYNPVTDRLIAASTSDHDTITVIDCAANRVVAEILGQPYVTVDYHLCADSLGAAYVSVPAADTVIVIRGDSAAARIPVGDYPGPLCYAAATGCVYCANRYDSSLSVIQQDRLVRTIHVGRNPGLLLYDPDSARLYCSQGDSGLAVIALPAESIIARIPTRIGAMSLAYNARHRKVYHLPGANNPVRDTLLVIDADRNAVTARIGVAPWANVLLYEPNHDQLFCLSSGGTMTVIDGAGDSILDTFDLGIGDESGLCAAPDLDRLFAGAISDPRLLVIDAATGRPVDTIVLASDVRAVAVNVGGTKLCFADYPANALHIADPATGQIIRTLPTRGHPSLLLAPPAHDKVYVGIRFPSAVLVMSLASDSVVAIDTMPSYPYALCYDALDDVVYTACHTANTLVAISGTSDSVIAELVVRRDPISLCWNSIENKLYVGSDYTGDRDSTLVIDCATNAVRASLWTPGEPIALLHNPLNNRVYCAVYDDDRIFVIDGATDRIVDTLPSGNGPYALCLNPRSNRLYCANRVNDSVTVIDCSRDSIIARVEVGENPYALNYNPRNNTIYCANRYDNSVSVISGSTHEVIATIPVGRSPRTIAYDPVNNRTFIGNYSSATVSVIRDSMSGVTDQPSARPEDLELAIRPTVTSGLLHVRFSRPLDRALTIGVFDPAGRQARTFALSPTSTRGLPAVDLDLRTLASGVYFVRSVPAGRLSAQKIIVRR